MIGSLMFFLLTLLPVVIYRGFLLSSNISVAHLLGGASVSLLLMPLIGLFYWRIPYKKILNLFVLFLYSHVALSHLFFYVQTNTITSGPLIQTYAGVVFGMLPTISLSFMYYVVLKPITKVDVESIIAYKNLRFIPLFISIVAISYGTITGFGIFDLFHYGSLLNVMIISILCCCALVSIISFYLLSKLSKLDIEQFVNKENYVSKSVTDKNIVLFIILFVVLSGLAEVIRGYWLFWFLITLAIVFLLTGQWQILRHLFLPVEESHARKESGDLFINIYSIKFVAYNMIVYLIFCFLLIALTVFR